jgi:hypothetical protein
VVERIVDSALLWPALVFFEIGLQLRFGFIGIGYEFPARPECQSANVAIRSVRSAPDESDDSELSVRHGDIMAVCSGRVKFVLSDSTKG